MCVSLCGAASVYMPTGNAINQRRVHLHILCPHRSITVFVPVCHTEQQHGCVSMCEQLDTFFAARKVLQDIV